MGPTLTGVSRQELPRAHDIGSVLLRPTATIETGAEGVDHEQASIPRIVDARSTQLLATWTAAWLQMTSV